MGERHFKSSFSLSRFLADRVGLVSVRSSSVVERGSI